MPAQVEWPVGVLAVLVVVAILVNRFAPTHRRRLRGALLLFALYIIVDLAAGPGLREAGQDAWANRADVTAEVLRAMTLVNLGGLFVFGVLLRAFAPPTIARDLTIAVAYVIAVMVVSSQHGLDPTGIFTAGAVVSAVIAISLQNTLGNILGGVALQLDGSIHEGDWIQLENGKQGKVRAIRWRHTLVETRDWSTIVVPNAQLLGSNITILGYRDGAKVPTRYWVWFSVDFRYPPSKVIQVVTEAIHGSPIENVAAEPKPSVVCMDFLKDGHDSYAAYAVRYWLTDLAVDDPTNSRVRARIYTALRRANIPLAIPAQMNLIEMHDEAREKSHHERQVVTHLDAIDDVSLFQGFAAPELRAIAEGMSHVIYTNGEIITRQGAVAHWLYVMTSGKAEVRTSEGADTKVVATLEAPTFFGEMGLMTGEARTADVVAVGDVECFRLGKASFEKVMLARPEIAENLADTLAKRRIGLVAAREGLSNDAREKRMASERERILGGIKSFFGL